MAAAVKVPIVVSFQKEGVVPPLFVAGTFSDPPWEPKEMDASIGHDGVHKFKAKIYGTPGTRITYKFKTAAGEWLLDDKTESVVDYKGHRNNSVDVPRPQTPHIRQPVPTASQPSSTDAGDWLDIDPFSRKGRAKAGGSSDWDSSQDRIPLFAHECLVPESHSPCGSSGLYSPTNLRASSQVGFDHEPDKLELEDPALETFPSGLDEISELIHKVEEDLEEDETEVEGVPPSAVLGVPRSKTNDVVGEFIGGSPVTSPVGSRPSRRHNAAVPKGSGHSDASVSLLSIAEGADEGDYKISSPVMMTPGLGWRSKSQGLHAWSEDDEAVVMNDPRASMASRGRLKPGSQAPEKFLHGGAPGGTGAQKPSLLVTPAQIPSSKNPGVRIVTNSALNQPAPPESRLAAGDTS